jgi:hypothetical protein
LPSLQGTSSTTTAVATATVDSSHPVQQEDQESPQGDELEAPLVELIVTGRRQMATGTDSCGTLTRSHGHLEALPIGTEAGVLIDKAPKAMTTV